MPPTGGRVELGPRQIVGPIAEAMPAISRALAGGDWATCYRLLRDVGARTRQTDPDEFAWQALHALIA